MRLNPPQELAAVDAAASTPRPAMPAPILVGSPQCIDAGDRRVRVLMSVRHPCAALFADFLSFDECDALIEAARSRMRRSPSLDYRTGGDQIHEARTSSGMFFARGENELIARIEARVSRLLNWPAENCEGMQVLNYLPGAQYKPHYDYFDPAQPSTPAILRRGGQRVASFLMYLNDPIAGGGTVFPDAGIEIVPQKGHALFFSYDRPHPATKSLHGGAPVIAGEKWLATKWVRQGRFD